MDIREAYEDGMLALAKKRGLGSIRQLEHDVLQALLNAVRDSVIGGPVLWFPMTQKPTVEIGRELRALGCWRSNDALARVAAGEIYYLNRVNLDWSDEAGGIEILDADGTATGWFERYEGVDGAVTFEPISDQFVTHMGWAYMPTMRGVGHAG